MATVAFAGFRPEIIEFLAELGRNNNRDWFEAHRDDYQRYLLEPARGFVLAMGECLPTLGPDIHAEPKIHGSIFTINRDIRFSTDKRPYKTHLDLWFWQGTGPSRERPGYYFRLTPETLTLGAGMHAFTPQALERFRAAVLDPVQGLRLEDAARAITGTAPNGFELGGQTYKRVPGGLPADHSRADWLRYSGLFAGLDQPVPSQLFSDQLPELCLTTYQRLAPLQQWLVDLLAA